MKQVHIYLPNETHRKFKYLAWDEDSSMSEIARGLIEKYLEKNEGEEKIQ